MADYLISEVHWGGFCYLLTEDNGQIAHSLEEGTGSETSRLERKRVGDVSYGWGVGEGINGDDVESDGAVLPAAGF